MGPVAPPAVAEERQGVLDEPYVILGASSRMGLPLTQATQPPREKNARRVTSTWTALRTSLGDRHGGRCRRDRSSVADPLRLTYDPGKQLMRAEACLDPHRLGL
jgi:hypothetical protein